MNATIDKILITIVKKDDIFNYLQTLNSHGIKIYVLDFDNFEDLIIEQKYNFKRKDIKFDCIVNSKIVYTDSTIEDEFNKVTNDEFLTKLIEYTKENKNEI